MRFLLLAVLAGCPDPDDTGETDTDDPVTACAFDEDDASDAANDLDGSAQGYICPPGDQDWYAFDVPGGDDLVEVGVAIEDTPVSPVQITWTLWDDGAANVVGTPESSEAATAEQALSIVHAASSGPHLLQVREVGNNGEDIRHPYSLTVATHADADTHETNDGMADATDGAGSPLTGYVSYRADEDWYEVVAVANSILRVSLAMDAGGIEPAFRVVDASETTLVATSNPSGTVQATDLVVVHPLVDAGAYYVVVSDDDKRDTDLVTPYTLTLTVADDPDGNEPNDHPDDATALAAQSCGSGWTSWVMDAGYVSSTGDVDWFTMPLSACSGSLLEARAVFDTATPLPAGMEAAIRLVRDVPGNPCSVDQDCQALTLSCTEDLDCAGFGNTCLGSFQCAGAGVCLPSGNCGATVVAEVADAGSSHSVDLSAPLFGQGTAWIAVSDFQGNQLSTDHAYAVDVRVRQDPDVNEVNNTYTGGPPVGSDANRHTPLAVEIPVHDCAPEEPADSGDPGPPPVPDCCDSTKWVRGSLGYAYDQDWFRYQHPCPGEDCMVRIVYEFDGGPTDHYLRMFQGNGLWFDTLAGTTDTGTQPPIQGEFGGLDPADQCFYAYQDHSGSPFWYHLAIRDTVYVSPSQPQGGTWDHDPDQEYRICVDKIANECAEPPCELFVNGCGVP